MRAAVALFAFLTVSSLAQAPAASKSFVIADVHVSPFNANPFMHGNSTQGDRYFLTQASMLDLIATAYGVDAANVQGGPTWLERDRYDLRAKVPAKITPDDIKLMLRGMLAERFHLVVKAGSAPLPAYVLTSEAGKPKIRESEGTDEGRCMPAPPPPNQPAGAPSYRILNCKNMAIPALADTIHLFAGDYLGQPVVDETRLAGTYDFTLKWSGKDQLEKQGADGISIFAAMEKQLGLKLELKTAPRPVFQVASVDEIPTPNAANIAEALPEPPASPFEVATIKPSTPGAEGYGRITGDQIETRAIPLMFLIRFGWDLNPNNKESVVNAPAWLDSTKFDIVAKAGANVRVDKFASGNLINYEDLRNMVRAMVADRFQMKWHMEDRPITAYTLTAMKPKLKPTTDPTERTKCKEGPGPDGKDPRVTSSVLNRLVTCQNMTLAQIGDELQRVANGYIYNTVVDGTGIKGSYDFTLSFSSADKVQPGAGDAAVGSDPNGALSVFDAVSRQLGLKLEKTKRPSPVLVIDHIEETPTEN
ncbi:TIGR03435 family protein [Granulicella tundricola]|uniref:Uncharacterized protein n=1 Tax=Granulicella tundricola (strain ATCC BAA-1859 / DSM 23138 / MP5ACTX9) TaxID=1198114 RepID=E8WYW8_GRATM|nr:TIGR03435 family protein [Granulicella tundricola]ADW68804.1 hypothetical protein AciX9_1756 [Granulicella tundricola MP5ACTX9]